MSINPLTVVRFSSVRTSMRLEPEMVAALGDVEVRTKRTAEDLAHDVFGGFPDNLISAVRIHLLQHYRRQLAEAERRLAVVATAVPDLDHAEPAVRAAAVLMVKDAALSRRE